MKGEIGVTNKTSYSKSVPNVMPKSQDIINLDDKSDFANLYPWLWYIDSL